MLEAIQTLNRYGLEVVSGIILGLDSDTTETEAVLTISSIARRSRC
jgi:hopanoid C-2 methylase